jgi:succinyl-diaminopimelate desuccinylase
LPDVTTVRSSRVDPALAAIDRAEGCICDDLAALLAVDTSFPPGDGYTAFADLLERLLAPLGFTFRRVTVPPALWRGASKQEGGDRINLIAMRGTGRPVCGLYFHTDTVPAGDGWSCPPLALTRDGTRLIGRGAADMKGTIVAALLALRTMDANGIAPAYDPMLLFCTDEEGGLYPGIRYLAEQQLIEGHLLSFNGGAAPRIWAGCFGSFDLRVSLTGKAVHSGDPVGGLNAIEAALPLLNALATLKMRVETRRSALPTPPHFGDRPLTALLTIAAAHGGQKGSSLPARFELLINRRYAPEECFDDALNELHRTIADATSGAGLGVEVELLGHLAPVYDPTGPHWPRWQRALSAGFGFSPDEFRAWGASSSSDMGWVQQAGIREILLGGLGRPDNNVHGADEFTTLGDIRALARAILAYLAADFAADLMPEPESGSAS